MNTSATPAIAFTAVIHNPLSTSANASFLFNLPLGIEPDTQRVKPQMTPPLTKSTPGSILGQHQVPSEMDCFDYCNKNDSCMSWSYNGTNQSCSLFDDVRMNGHKSGFYSGVKVLLHCTCTCNIPYYSQSLDLLWYSWNAPVACEIFFL